MVRKIQQFEISCDTDGCRSSEVYFGDNYDKPTGWKQLSVHNCGLTGYTRVDDLCPKCSKKKGLE